MGWGREREREREGERERKDKPENYTLFVVTGNGVMFIENILPNATRHFACFTSFKLLR